MFLFSFPFSYSFLFLFSFFLYVGVGGDTGWGVILEETSKSLLSIATAIDGQMDKIVLLKRGLTKIDRSQDSITK